MQDLKIDLQGHGMIDIDHHRGYILAVPKFYPGNRNKQIDDVYTVSANQARFAFPSSKTIERR